MCVVNAEEISFPYTISSTCTTHNYTVKKAGTRGETLKPPRLSDLDAKHHLHAYSEKMLIFMYITCKC
jgi:hypothetical protein